MPRFQCLAIQLLTLLALALESCRVADRDGNVAAKDMQNL